MRLEEVQLDLAHARGTIIEKILERFPEPGGGNPAGPGERWTPEPETQQDSFRPALGPASLWETVLSSPLQPRPAALRSQAPIPSLLQPPGGRRLSFISEKPGEGL